MYDVATRDLELSPLSYRDSTDDSILNLRKPPGACCSGYKYSINLPARLTEKKNLFFPVVVVLIILGLRKLPCTEVSLKTPHCIHQHRTLNSLFIAGRSEQVFIAAV